MVIADRNSCVSFMVFGAFGDRKQTRKTWISAAARENATDAGGTVLHCVE